MTDRIARRLVERLASTREVAPTGANARRLWECYQRSFLDDDRLRDALRNGQPMAGLTERLSVEDLERALDMPDTIGLELSSGDETRAFVIIRYAGTDSLSLGRFREYLSAEARIGKAWLDDHGRAKLEERLSRGNIISSVEFVAGQQSLDAPALLLAVYRDVVRDRLASDDASLIGKCLDRVRWGAHANSDGNLGIKGLAKGFDLERIGEIEHERPLRGGESARLAFGIYLGGCERIRKTFENLRLDMTCQTTAARFG